MVVMVVMVVVVVVAGRTVYLGHNERSIYIHTTHLKTTAGCLACPHHTTAGPP